MAAGGRSPRGPKASDREALLLLAWEELSYSEIAEATDVPVGTVRSRINRARRPGCRPHRPKRVRLGMAPPRGDAPVTEVRRGAREAER
ncbi:sigma factor-like helix-turn-helix DNA-binding protein [Iamia sp. SCSIO 61187]|uniref:sigma factor-like helix-turn-helix DNA-binding protein n=1 Tax=Iamia sp. SCSIO 61187 TaxID=2722752 RepID=UPI00351D5B3A